MNKTSCHCKTFLPLVIGLVIGILVGALTMNLVYTNQAIDEETLSDNFVRKVKIQAQDDNTYYAPVYNAQGELGVMPINDNSVIFTGTSITSEGNNVIFTGTSYSDNSVGIR